MSKSLNPIALSSNYLRLHRAPRRHIAFVNMPLGSIQVPARLWRANHRTDQPSLPVTNKHNHHFGQLGFRTQFSLFPNYLCNRLYLDGPAVVSVNIFVRSISKIDDVTMVSRQDELNLAIDLSLLSSDHGSLRATTSQMNGQLPPH